MRGSEGLPAMNLLIHIDEQSKVCRLPKRVWILEIMETPGPFVFQINPRKARFVFKSEY